MACVSKGLIIGGGIAGLSAALALARAGGQCDVLELADAPLGASLGLSGRAAEALDELGVYEACHATGRSFTSASTAMQIRDASGGLLSPGPQRPQWPGAKDGVAVYRPEFLKILTEAALRAGVNIRYGVTAEAIEDNGDAAVVTLSGGEQRRYDFVIGADGIGSRTREMIFPAAPRPAYSGQMSFRWMIPGPPVEGEGWYVGPVGRLGFYHLPHQQLVYVPAVIDMPERTRTTDAEVLALFTRLLDSFTAPPVIELRRHLTADTKVIFTAFNWISVPAPWHRGRTLLIGDAAHATTAHMGMGGGMALEDAVVLAQCIAAASNLTEAFEAFMARRFERVRTVVETSVALSRLEQAKAPPSENAALLTSAFAALAEPY